MPGRRPPTADVPARLHPWCDMRIIGAEVRPGYGWIIRFRLKGGGHVDRDFAFVRGGVLDFIRKDRRKFRRIRIIDGCPAWRNRDGSIVDLCPDAILRGGIGRGRPPGSAVIGPGGTLIPDRDVWRKGES